MCKGVKLRVTLLTLLTVLTGFITVILTANYSKAEPKVLDSIPVVEDKVPNFMSNPPQEGLMEALIYYEVDHPEIVYAQAVLETGNFTSSGCRNKNNLFGLMQGKSLRRFNHWTESVIFYKQKIQSRYKGGDYYAFLTRIGYAANPNYNAHVRKIVEQNKRKKP